MSDKRKELDLEQMDQINGGAYLVDYDAKTGHYPVYDDKGNKLATFYDGEKADQYVNMLLDGKLSSRNDSF